MKCPKTWCSFRHLACEKLKEDDPRYSCYREGQPPFRCLGKSKKEARAQAGQISEVKTQ